MTGVQTCALPICAGDIELSEGDLIIQRNELEGVKVLNDNKLTVGFDTRITQALLDEGIARDLVRTIQNLRKEKEFQVSDRISLKICCDPEIRAAFEKYKEYIGIETLCEKSEFVNALDCDCIECSDKQIKLDIKVVE